MVNIAIKRGLIFKSGSYTELFTGSTATPQGKMKPLIAILVPIATFFAVALSLDNLTQMAGDECLFFARISGLIALTASVIYIIKIRQAVDLTVSSGLYAIKSFGIKRIFLIIVGGIISAYIFYYVILAFVLILTLTGVIRVH